MAPHLGHFWSTIAGAFLCVLRARFFRLEVRRFGTAMGHVAQLVVVSRSLLRRNATQCVPPGVPRFGTRAGTFVQILATRRAESFALGPTYRVRRHVQ